MSKPTLVAIDGNPAPRPKRKRAPRPASFEVQVRNTLEQVLKDGARAVVILYEVHELDGTQVRWTSCPLSGALEVGCVQGAYRELVVKANTEMLLD